MVFALPMTVDAAQFPVVGPRALGMGGASVAAVNDSTAVYWNPAALEDFRRFEVRLPAGAAIHDYIDLQDKWDRIDVIQDAVDAGDYSAAFELRQLFLDLDRPNAAVNIDANAGLLVSVPLESSTVAVSLLGIGFAELHPAIDTLHLNTSITSTFDNIALNDSAVSAFGVVTAEPAISFATSAGEHVLLGVNAKMVYASTFLHSAMTRSGDFDTFIDDMNNSETKSHKASIDAGILYKPLNGLAIGLVGRYLNSPSFPASGLVAVKGPAGDVTLLGGAGREIEIKPQYRGGVAWKPFDNLTLSADYDLSKNKSFTENTEEQTIAGGAELTVLREVLSLRAGAYKNTANPLANIVYTAGLGLRILAFRLDLAGAYDFDEQEAQASLSVALRF